MKKYFQILLHFRMEKKPAVLKNSSLPEKYPREDEHLGIGYLVDDKLKFEPKKYLSSIHYR